MAKKFLTGLTLVNLPSDPSVGSEGELYFNTSASVAKIYKEGAWSELGAGGGAAITVSTTEPASPNIGDAWYKNDTGEFYVYDGTYWVEVNGVVSITQEQVQDYVAPLFTNATNTNVIATYDDANNVINLNTSGSLISVDSIRYPDFITFDTTPEIIPTEQGSIYWDSGDTGLRVLANNTSILLGQEQYATVKNATGSSIAKGKVVYINGAQGQRPTIALADADTEPTSSKTFGITAEAIADGAEGVVTTEGILRGLNTDGLTEGGAIWLSSTAGNFTQTIPTQPVHGVFLGYVVKAHASSGEIYVKIQNGYEINELHNVLINGVSDNQTLVYNSSASLWYNESIVNSLEGTTNEIDVSASVGNLTLSLPSDLITPGDLTVTGNLTVSGSTTFINTETLNIEDNIILLNSNVSGSPSVNAGIEIERGSLDNVSLLWNETSDKWTLTNNGTTSYPIATQNGYTYNSVINIRSYDGITDGAINLESYLNAIRLSDDDGVIITTGSGSSTFIFNNSAQLEFPDASLQNTAFLGMSAYTTDNLPEGSVNLYFTDARARTALSADLGGTNGGIRIIAPSATADATLSNDSATHQVIVGPSGSGTDIKGNLSVLASPSISDPGNLNVAGSITGSSIIKDGGTSSQFLKADGSIDSNTYLTSYTETDPVFSASDAAGIDATDISNWNTAYGWGNHASAGYALSSHNHTLDSLSNVVITGTPSDGQAIVWDTTTSKWVNETVSGGGASYPDQTGNDGKFLQTNSGSVSWQNVDFTGYLTESSASTIYLTQSSASSTYQPIGSYLTSESDTLETVTDRGASSTNAITISNTTQATNATTGALIVSGGVGVAKDLWIDGNLHVAGTTTTENTKTVATHDNLIYLNAALDSTITNAVYSSGSITYTAENLYTAGMDIRITGVDPSGFNISTGDNLTVASATPTYFIVIKSDPGASYVSGGTAHAKEEANPDLGFAGGYYDSGYAHAGLFRDASDGIFKIFDGYTPEPDESVNIDTGHASFSFAPIKVESLDVVDAATTRTNLGLAIGTDIQQYSPTLAAVAGGTYTGELSITTLGTISFGTWNGTAIGYAYGGTGLTTLGTAGQVLAVNASATAIEWITPSGGGGGGLTTTTTSITTNSATAIESFAIATSRTAEALIQITQGTDYYCSKVVLIHDGTTVKMTEYAILESTTGAIPLTISAAISGSNLELRATITDAATTNATAKVVLIEVAV